MKKWLFLSAVLISCSKPLPDLLPLNLEQWKDDKGACKGIRSNSIAEWANQQDKLKGLSEKEVIKLLGRPDENELYKRNQKFYYYDLEPGKLCSDSIGTNLQLVLRFNAMGYAKEVAVER